MAITKLLRIKETRGASKSSHLKNNIFYICNPEKTSGGCWIGGCFAGDDSAFYAMAVASRYDDPYTLIRYDLETGEAALCAGFTVNNLPAMTTLADGSIVMLIDTRRETEPQALARVMPDG